MTEKDWNFVEGVWKMLREKFAPKIEEVTERLTGVAVPMEKGLDIQTPFGDKRGGYFPLIPDPYWTLHHQPTKLNATIDVRNYNPLPNAKATHKRTGKVYPLDLEFDHVPARLLETAHHIFFREPTINARKILARPDIRFGTTKAFGPEYTELLDPWVNWIANDGGAHDLAGSGWKEKLLRASIEASAFMRTNTIAVLLGYNPGTPFIHGASALFNSLHEAGVVPFMSSTVDLMFKNKDNTQSHIEWAYDNSAVVRNRNHDFDQDLGRMMDKALGQGGLSRARVAHIQFSTALIKYLDLYSFIPTFHAGYKKAIADGMSHEDAIYYGEKLARNAHGASGIVDVPAIQRLGEFARWGTMFYGYFNHNYNQLRNFGRMLGGKLPPNMSGGAAFWTLLGASVAYIFAPGIIHGLIRHPPSVVSSALFGDEPDDEESLLAWFAIQTGAQVISTVPIVRDAVQAMYGFTPTPTPLFEIYKSAHMLLGDAKREWNEKEPSKKTVQHIVEFPGWFTGLTTRPMARASQFVWDTATGQQEPETTSEWLRGLTTGSSQPPRKRH
jgi:hypothetical protein